MKKYILSLLLLLSCLGIEAQRFFNLTSPQVTYSIPLYDNYADSVYTISIEYPEFISMSDVDVRNYYAITKEPLPKLPKVQQQISISRKKASLEISLIPLV